MVSSALSYSAQHILPNNRFEGALPGSVLSDGLGIKHFSLDFSRLCLMSQSIPISCPPRELDPLYSLVICDL